ncbi:hypothetical protein CLHOM_30150 [Clostridium homopropionicum DSM 5847]|uniref:Transcription factor NikR nickel binding C-terminal domain-containing protein n=1 Tax=Clostridium homopropionicum DSM 5847 TaxID=1121318 RepID=A0A0L6Z6Z4_9CLOT|nr:hypothetical protein [Clostridium homopropionicum]KOA18731.1 hypothetical protein CLHOM_30150 [Clostridium homopropionicum DSM 5847]SFG54177.1 hypothetical protein SAMN04488501_110152 [Clostridium homopropionicum]
METTIMAVAIDPRSEHAPQVQTVLTKHGCIISTRLGLHEASKDHCSNRGLIILHVNGETEQFSDLKRELEDVEGVKVKHMTI